MTFPEILAAQKLITFLKGLRDTIFAKIRKTNKERKELFCCLKES
jgi:hypothetical protein